MHRSELLRLPLRYTRSRCLSLFAESKALVLINSFEIKYVFALAMHFVHAAGHCTVILYLGFFISISLMYSKK
jgi:hypothetical protein